MRSRKTMGYVAGSLVPRLVTCSPLSISMRELEADGSECPAHHRFQGQRTKYPTTRQTRSASCMTVTVSTAAALWSNSTAELHDDVFAVRSAGKARRSGADFNVRFCSSPNGVGAPRAACDNAQALSARETSWPLCPSWRRSSACQPATAIWMRSLPPAQLARIVPRRQAAR